MNQDYLDLRRQVLDRQLIDANNIPCGKVDDLEIEITPTNEVKIKSILVDSGAWAHRLPALLCWLVKKISGDRLIRIPWEEVSVITHQIKLRSKADELGLATAERGLSVWMKRLPKGS